MLPKRKLRRILNFQLHEVSAGAPFPLVVSNLFLFSLSSLIGPGSGPQEVSTRVMIFSSFRESVQEIAAMLNRHLPLVKVMTFMGQASAGKGVKGFTQKEQLEVKTLCSI